MSIIEFLQAINGIGQLWGQDGQFLGILSSNPNDYNSITNSNGPYGSAYAATSIQNQYGLYGGQHGLYSPYNPHCLQPPVILYQGQALLIVTRNPYLLTNNLQVVDPDLIFSIYSHSTTSNTPDITALHLQSLSQAAQTNAQLLSNAMWIGMNGPGVIR